MPHPSLAGPIHQKKKTKIDRKKFWAQHTNEKKKKQREWGTVD